MDQLVEKEISECRSCQTTVYKHEKEPLIMSKLPDGHWENVKIDFFRPLPSGDYILSVADGYSRWVELEIVKSTSASSTIPALDKIFAAYGIPYQMTTDNGPPLKGAEIQKFARYLDMKHRNITPFWLTLRWKTSIDHCEKSHKIPT